MRIGYVLKSEVLDRKQDDMKSFPAVSVIIPAFSMGRWDNLCAAVASVQAQTVEVPETVVVIDHNAELLEKAMSELVGVTVVANVGSHGASGARNTGVAASRGEVLVFLDDDAVAGPDCLRTLLQHFTNPLVVGVGGRLDPLWKTRRPWWFPLEFDWTVGCSYLGMPEIVTHVRNVWSNNMAIRRYVFDAAGGFRDGFGKVGAKSRPEDTDLCLRAAECNEEGIWIYEPNAVACHWIPAERATFGYFLKRCYHEGQGKAALSSFNGVTESTSTERQYARRVLPRGIARGLWDTAHGEASGMGRSFVIVAGLSSATVGFVVYRSMGKAVARCWNGLLQSFRLWRPT
jgi:glycosyltransferase involved in cell wall biosynthesis